MAAPLIARAFFDGSESCDLKFCALTIPAIGQEVHMFKGIDQSTAPSKSLQHRRTRWLGTGSYLF